MDDKRSKCLDKTNTPTATTQQHLLVDSQQKEEKNENNIFMVRLQKQTKSYLKCFY